MNLLDCEQLEDCYKIARKVALRLKAKDMLTCEPAKAMFVFSSVIDLIDKEEFEGLDQDQDCARLYRFHVMCERMGLFKKDISSKKISHAIIDAYVDAVQEIIANEGGDND